MLSPRILNHSSRWLTVGLLAATVLSLGGGGLPRPVSAAAQSVEGVTVEDARGDQRSPRISGDWVVWEDYRRSTEAPANPTADTEVTWLADIRVRNLASGEERRLTSAANAEHPAISGTLAVWAELNQDGNRDLVVYDVEAREVVRRIRNDGDQDYPAISGRTVVWQDNRRDVWDIRGYDLDARDEFIVQRADSHQTRPSIHGDLVAWQDSRASGRIWYKRLNSDSAIRIDEVDTAFEPAVRGDLIAFRVGGSRDNPDGADIYVYDTTEGTLRAVNGTNDGQRGGPALSDRLVTWWDARGRDRDIWAYDLRTETEFKVNNFSASSDDRDQDAPAVSGTTVVWVDHRGNDADIRGALLGLEQPTTPTPTPVPVPTTQPLPPVEEPLPVPPITNVPRDERYFPTTGFRINNDRFWEYFNLRGGVPTFGYPISREFTFLGFPVQFFQGHIMQLMPDGRVTTMNLLQEGLMPATHVNGSTFPAPDPAIIAETPRVTDPNYAQEIVEFTRQNAPNQFNGRPVRFFDTFVNTVDPAAAFPGTTPDPALLPLLNLEIWGAVTSRPMADPSNPDFVYQRFQRGIMHYRQDCGCTERILLADWFKTVITGQGLPSDLAADMAGSPYLRQYDNRQPNGVARPAELPNTDMRFAFEPYR